MILNLKKELEVNKAVTRLTYLIQKKSTIDLTELSDKRSSLQNRSLHKFFIIISDELNELGMEFHYFGVTGKQLSTRYTTNIVKNHFWRPIQQTLFNIESTKDINTKQINEITDVIVKFFGDKGVYVEFPNRESLKDS